MMTWLSDSGQGKGVSSPSLIVNRYLLVSADEAVRVRNHTGNWTMIQVSFWSLRSTDRDFGLHSSIANNQSIWLVSLQQEELKMMRLVAKAIVDG